MPLKLVIATVVVLGGLQVYTAHKEEAYYAKQNAMVDKFMEEAATPARTRTFQVKRIGKNSWMEWEVTDARK